MPHMVIYRSADGKPAYHQTEALEDAARFVERLRNEEQVNESRIFRMEEVPIEFKTYYRVEVAVGEAPAAPAPVEAAAPAPAPVAEAESHGAEDVSTLVGDIAEPTPVGNGAGRFGLFGKS